MRLDELILDLLFPKRCVVCGAEGSWSCSECEAVALKDYVPEVLPLEHGLAVVSLFDFGQPLIRERLHYLKYNGIRTMAGELVEIAKRHLSDGWIRDMFGSKEIVLVPVPTTKSKLKGRGYNQAEVAAESLAQWFESPILKLISRSGAKSSQVGKNAAMRRVSTMTAFSLDSEKLPEDTESKIFLLVDDVCTTGSTLVACARLLKDRGMTVGAVVLAHKQGQQLL